MNIFQIHAAILQGLHEQIQQNFPDLDLRLEIGVTRLTARYRDGSRAFILVLDEDGIMLQSNPSKKSYVDLEQFTEFEYADPRVFDQINRAISEVCGIKLRKSGMLAHEIERARDLYESWFARNPGVRNPTDLNAEAKFRFAMDVGWEDYCLMQRARKAGFDFTKPEEHEPQATAECPS